jgi:hypothetical protein
MIEDKKGHIYTANWTRNIIIDMIKKDLDNWTITELSIIKNDKTIKTTYQFTKEEEYYE